MLFERSITLLIAKQNLGLLNSEEDNQAYTAEVQQRLVEAFPDTDVSVDLTTDGNKDVVTLTGFDLDSEDVKDAVREIAQDVWNTATY